MTKLYIVSPCYNEEEVIRWSADTLTGLLQSFVSEGTISPDSRVLYVNDGSKDSTWSIIKELHASNPFILGLNLSRNVGHQNAIMAGMMTARQYADAVITIDADLQDDLNAISEMLKKYEAGCDIVYGVKVDREADSFMKKASAVTFYRFQHAMGVKAIHNHADFRLMSKSALDELSLYRERGLYLRGLIPMLGLPSDTVDDVLSPRYAGSSKYTLGKMLRLAIDGITSFSTKPISVILGLGGLCLLVSCLMLVYIFASWISGHVVPGWSSLMLSIWFVGSALLISVGVVGLYVGRIYEEVKQRPLYNIKEKLL